MVEDKSIEDKFILAVDTTTSKTSVSLAEGGNILKTLVNEKGLSQSSGLLILIDTLLRSQGLKIDEIDLFSIATGPGSFTGARVGISTIKGLSYSLGKDCVGVPTLKALAYTAGISELTLTILPAGRQEIFAQKFKVNEKGVVISLTVAVCASIKEILEEVKYEPNVKWIGDGVKLLEEEIKSFAEKSEKVIVDQSERAGGVQPFGGWCLVDSGYVISESVALLATESLRRYKVINNLRVEYVRPTL